MEETRCAFFVVRKNRSCKMRCKVGEKYCGEHSGMKEENKSRIPCPFDPKHTVESETLEKHLKKCNARPKVKEPFFKENCNLPPNKPTANERSHNLASLFQTLLRHEVSLAPSKGYDNLVDLKEPVGESSKHRLQNEALGNLAINLVKRFPESSRIAIVELGAGKGGLSLHLAREGNGLIPKSAHFFLLDRKNSRRKGDCFVSSCGFKVSRIWIDLKDIDFETLLGNNFDSVIFLGKHLCGAATCLSLNSITRLASAMPNLEIGVVIATCCHQLCEIDFYSDSYSWKDLELNDFSLIDIAKASSWAVCQNRLPQTTEYNPVTLGQLCKQAIDYCRRRKLSGCGFSTNFITYTSPTISPENRCIVADKSPSV